MIKTVRFVFLHCQRIGRGMWSCHFSFQSESFVSLKGNKKMKALLLFMTLSFLLVLLSSCTNNTEQPSGSNTTAISTYKEQIAMMLDSFNIAAANSEYEKYFSFFADDATFIGTDATENWDKNSYMKWAKPYFDKKTTWNFKSLNRHIYFGTNKDIAWFDELLETRMKICRGSGVVEKQNNKWRIKQYVLSMTIPNSKTGSVIELKAQEEDSLINNIRKN